MTAACSTRSGSARCRADQRRRRSCPRRPGSGRIERRLDAGRMHVAPVSILRHSSWRRRLVPPAELARSGIGFAQFLKHSTGDSRRALSLAPPEQVLAAIRPPPAISTAAIAIFALGLAKRPESETRSRAAASRKRQLPAPGCRRASCRRPGVERGADRSDTERCDREPLHQRVGHTVSSTSPCTNAASSEVADRTCDRVGRTDLSRRDNTE